MSTNTSNDGLTALPDADADELVRSMGLMVCHAGIYGMGHEVAKRAADAAFSVVARLLVSRREIEVSLHEKTLLVNRVATDVERSTGRLLCDQMLRNSVHDFSLRAPPDRGEFLRFAEILAAQTLALERMGGFAEAVKRAELRSVRVSNVVYRRVGADERPTPPPPEKPPTPRAVGNMFDVTEGLEGEMDLVSAFGAGAVDTVVSSIAAELADLQRSLDAKRAELVAAVRRSGAKPATVHALSEQLRAEGIPNEDWLKLRARISP